MFPLLVSGYGGRVKREFDHVRMLGGADDSAPGRGLPQCLSAQADLGPRLWPNADALPLWEHGSSGHG